MVEFTIYLSLEDFDRLYDIKEAEGMDDMTGNQFAQRIVERYIFSHRVKNDQSNSEEFREANHGKQQSN